MKETIPIYNINNLSGQSPTNPAIFFTQHQISNPVSSINIPYRSNYYGIGLCTKGKATLKANLETYPVEKNCIITMSPPVIKQWVHLAADYETMAVFFTKDFFIKKNPNKNYLDTFSFFDPNAKHVSQFSDNQAKTINIILKNIQAKLNEQHPYKYEIASNLIEILLFETAAVYDKENFISYYKQTRSEQLTTEFKKSVCAHFAQERSVQFYASLLFVSPKHLTEVVKQETGKSAKEWIDELVILEAKVLLQNPTLSIANIADRLSFANQAVFGKFFKNLTDLSPLAYRQSL